MTDSQTRASIERILIETARQFGVRLIVDPSESGGRWVAYCAEKFVPLVGSDEVIDASARQLPYDLLVNGRKVQCKSRKRKKSGQCALRKHTGQPYSRCDVDFFAIQYGDEHYLIPYDALCRDDGTLVNEFLVRYFSEYRDAWRLVCDGEAVKKPLPLFDCSAFSEATNG